MRTSGCHNNTVRYLSLGKGGKQALGLHDLEVIMEGLENAPSFRRGKDVITDRNSWFAFSEGPGHLLPSGGLPRQSPCIGELVGHLSILPFHRTTHVDAEVSITRLPAYS
ncbi:hypothetical protein TNIN_368121 [Trichonephila inaurata madagascariensis]|uniref:Uncharacterized protein n=1 Tax=Trichonephila inaurata madagascariensis TaxID=2747483 RepID=A0A8X6XDM1_9ARAC|nr:hypothetical protein TNIN_368121 [Trichonephila inaurata madagascariensis]